MRRPHHDSTSGDNAVVASTTVCLRYYGNIARWEGRELDQHKKTAH
ncbi:hypothetical protein JGC56_00370 [Salmonella enterica subsp. enterica serovar Saintpaul]|nr:hypothetical protein [Salmonella enterica subsp. enterica serovar Saintpaul]